MKYCRSTLALLLWLLMGLAVASGDEETQAPALAVRPPRKGPPALRGLKLHKPQPIPGVGQLRRAFAPCLTADLKTIVFANWFDTFVEIV